MGVRVIVRPDEIGIGIFGYGFMATAHAEAIRAVSREARLRLLAVCGPRREAAETFASRYGLPLACTEPELLLSYPGIDAVIIAAPDDAHRDLAVASVRAGKHILCEKPLATTLAQAREIEAAARAAGVRGMTGFLLRSTPAIQALAAEVARGTLGTVLAFHAQRYDAELLEPTAAMSWRYDSGRSGSGVLGDLGSHMIDLALMFGGPITEVSADLNTFVAALPGDGSGQMYPHLLDDDTILTLRFSSHAHGSIALSRVGLIDAQQPLGRSAIQVMGTRAAVATDGIEHGVFFRLGESPRELVAMAGGREASHTEVLSSMGERMMHGFAQAIREGRDLQPTLGDGLRVQAVIDAALRSSLSRRWERVAPT
jgi:predicted dehydrogenase